MNEDLSHVTHTLLTQVDAGEVANRRLLNEIQSLKGNIRVYCRVRPALKKELSSSSSGAFAGAIVAGFQM